MRETGTIPTGERAGSRKGLCLWRAVPDIRVPFARWLHPSANEPPLTIYDPSAPIPT
jgi:phosphomethylpyrimidine synthase